MVIASWSNVKAVHNAQAFASNLSISIGRTPPEGKLSYSMRGTIADYEREKKRLRTMTGRTGFRRIIRPFRTMP